MQGTPLMDRAALPLPSAFLSCYQQSVTGNGPTPWAALLGPVAGSPLFASHPFSSVQQWDLSAQQTSLRGVFGSVSWIVQCPMPWPGFHWWIGHLVAVERRRKREGEEREVRERRGKLNAPSHQNYRGSTHHDCTMDSHVLKPFNIVIQLNTAYPFDHIFCRPVKQFLRPPVCWLLEIVRIVGTLPVGRETRSAAR